MSNVAAASALVKKLPWDSDYFGFPVALVKTPTITPADQEIIEQFVAREKITLLQYLCNCHDRQSVLTAEAAGYSFVDIRYTLKRIIASDCPPVDAGAYRFARGTVADIQALREIAKDAYRDSRYYFDSHFDRQKIVDFFQEWAEKGVRGTLEDYASVLYDGHIPIAFCTIKKLAPQEAKIGLFGVDSSRRGAGIGTLLLRSVLHQLQNEGCSSVVVVTQGRNYPAQRLYQKCGFVTDKMELWYHKWYRTPLP